MYLVRIEKDKILCVGVAVKFRALFSVLAKHCGARSIMIHLAQNSLLEPSFLLDSISSSMRDNFEFSELAHASWACCVVPEVLYFA